MESTYEDTCYTSNNPLQSAWCYWTTNICLGSPVLIGWLGFLLILLPVYGGLSLVAWYIDTCDWAKWIRDEYKVQKESNLSDEKYKQVIKQVVFILLGVHVPAVLVMNFVCVWRGVSYDSQLPSLFQVE